MTRPTRVVSIETGRGSPSERGRNWTFPEVGVRVRVCGSMLAVGKPASAVVKASSVIIAVD
jgi:hypothetical protein